MMHLSTRDDMRRCPVTEIGDDPVRFIGVGGLATLHAISFVLDRRPIREILLVDPDEGRLAFTHDAIRAAMTSPTREAWLAQIYDVTPLRGEIRDWRDLQPFVGWNFGALLEGAFPLPAVPITTRVGAVSSLLEEWDDDTIVWVGDALASEAGSTANGGAAAPALRDRLRALDGRPNIRIYAAADGNEPPYQDVLVKDYAAMLVRQRPHFYTNEAIQRMRLGESMIYIMHDAGAPCPGQLPGSVLMGPEQFLNGDMTADTVTLHIMSQAPSPLHAETAKKGLASGRRLLVLEHNFHTEDRYNMHNEGMTLPQVRALVGAREHWVRWCFGRLGGLRRNFVASFAGHLS